MIARNQVKSVLIPGRSSGKPINTMLMRGIISRRKTPNLYMTRAMTTSRLSEYMHNKELSPKYIASVERAVRTIISRYDITTPSTDNAKILKAKLKAKNLKPNSIRLYLWAMRYWAQSLGRDIDFDECPTPKVTIEEPEIIDFRIIRKILDNPTLPERDRAIIALMAYSACRVGELVDLKTDDLKLDTGLVTYRRTKNNKSRTVPIVPECIEILKQWTAKRNQCLADYDRESPFVFVTNRGGQMSTDLVRQMMTRMKGEVGADLKKFHPHLIRHTSLTKMCNTKDVNLREVQQMAGHSSLTITERYTHVQLDQLQSKMNKNMTF